MVKRIIAYGGYYQTFMASIPKEGREKIQRALLLFSDNERIPSHYISFLRDGIYEFRVTYIHSEYRLLFIYDNDTMVILLNCFQKKTQKTPNREIEKAIKLKEEYYAEKSEQNL